MGANFDIITIAREHPGTQFVVTAADLDAMQNKTFERLKKWLDQLGVNKEAVELRTREEVMKQLNVAPSTLWRWKQSGYLVPINVGGQYRYKSTDINEILEGKK